jgi:hypothetical protein
MGEIFVGTNLGHYFPAYKDDSSHSFIQKIFQNGSTKLVYDFIDALEWEERIWDL